VTAPWPGAPWEQPARPLAPPPRVLVTGGETAPPLPPRPGPVHALLLLAAITAGSAAIPAALALMATGGGTWAVLFAAGAGLAALAGGGAAIAGRRARRPENR